ncbi:MAG: FAD:protein FMN transferase [Butyrivibrio sp.]|nr:FAD:protein FMN transferase [Butyrivibrio sp.]
MKKNTLIAAVSVLILLGMITVLYYLPRWQNKTYNQTAFVMGTVFSFSLEGKEDPTSELLQLGNSLEKDTLSRRVKDSEIAQINASAGDENGYPLSEEMEELLTTCFDISKKSEGAFDITLGALISLWDIDGWASGERGDAKDFRPPSKADISSALECCGYEKVRIENHRIYLPEGMIIDLGAVGKGLYLDKCRGELSGNINGIVSAGGSILTVGEKGDGSDWKVGITNPFEDGLYATAVLGSDKCVSTSGNYERFVEYEGVDYHHILDPKTGYPAWIKDSEEDSDDQKVGVASVTIVSDSGLLSDALSTACFVLGEEKALELSAEYGAEIFIIRTDGSSATEGNHFLIK